MTYIKTFNTVLSFSFIILVTVECNSNVLTQDIIVKGPGLVPEKVILPARYFYIYLKPIRSENYTGEDNYDSKALDVSIKGLTAEGKQCHIWTQMLDRKDSSFIVRYKIYGTCYDLTIKVLFKDRHVADSPYTFKGPVVSEDCYCPEKNIDKWLSDFGCTKSYDQLNKDLEQFTSVDFGKLHKKAVKRFNNSLSSSVCHYVVKDNKIYRSCYGQHIGFKMFMDAILLSLTRKVTLPDLEFFSNLGDWPLMKKDDQNSFPLFSWCGSNETADIVMPTYDITESTLESMGRVSLDMLSVQGNAERKWSERENKAFWRGRDSSRERLKLIDISREHPHLIEASLTNFFFFPELEETYGPKQSHVSFFSFFDYKFLLSLDGTVAAYRLPYLLAGGSLVFKQDSKYYEHFYNELKPWEHYVPVKNDLSDIVEKIQWGLENDKEAEKIARAGQKFANENFMPQDIICYHTNLFNQWSKKLESQVIIRNDMELVEQKNSKDCSCKQSKKDEL